MPKIYTFKSKKITPSAISMDVIIAMRFVFANAITSQNDNSIIEMKCWICNILIHYSLLLITFKNRRGDLVKSE